MLYRYITIVFFLKTMQRKTNDFGALRLRHHKVPQGFQSLGQLQRVLFLRKEDDYGGNDGMSYVPYEASYQK